MSQTKAQLVTPLAAAGIVTAAGVVATGVVTATSFDGDVVGSATSIISGGNLNVGIISATNFSGDFTGSATGIQTGAAIKVGSFTATSFTGDFTGTATSMMRGTGFEAGAVNATGFVANVTGNVTGNATGLAGSVTSGANIHIGVMTATSYVGDGSNLSGIAATNFTTQVVPGSTFSINVTSPAGGNYTLSGTDRSGTVSGSSDPAVTVEIGDTLNFVVDASGHPFYIRVSDGGANVSTPAATNQGSQSGTVSWTPNTAGTYYYQCGNHAGMIGTITVTATTTIDLSAGNMITFNQSANTTVSFANTSAAMDVTIIRVKDATTTARTITWPDSVKWDGGSAPTLITDSVSGDSQQFQFLTRDSGVTWYAWENFKYDGPYAAATMWGWGENSYGRLGLNTQGNPTSVSSPTQIGTKNDWVAEKTISTTGNSAGNRFAINLAGELWGWGWNNNGQIGLNDVVDRSSPTQIPGTTWDQVFNSHDMTVTRKTDGTMWVWGKGHVGQLGLNSPTNTKYSSPVQLGTEATWTRSFGGRQGTSIGVKTDGTFWSWGYNYHGMLGLNQSSALKISSPTQLGTNTTWGTSVRESRAGAQCVAAIKTDGTLWMWGKNAKGCLGLNQPSDNTRYSSPVQVGTNTNWTMISSSYRSMIALKDDNTLWTWGDPDDGVLGLNQAGSFPQSPRYQTARSSPTQIPGTWKSPITTAVYATGAFKTDGTFWIWGDNFRGELGLNTPRPSQISSPTQLPGSSDWIAVGSAGRGMIGFQTAV